MSAELDLFGNPLPASTPPAPVYDRGGLKKPPVIPVLAPPVIITEDNRPYEIIRDGKYTAWLLYT